MSVHKTVNAAFLRVFQSLVVAAGSADEVSRQTFTVAIDGFYSPDRKPKDIREVRDEERLVTLLL